MMNSLRRCCQSLPQADVWQWLPAVAPPALSSLGQLAHTWHMYENLQIRPMSTGPDEGQVITSLGFGGGSEKEHKAGQQEGMGSGDSEGRTMASPGPPQEELITRIGGGEVEDAEASGVITHLGSGPVPAQADGKSEEVEELGVQLASALPKEMLPKVLVRGRKRRKRSEQMDALPAIEELKKASKAKFNESVEVHFRLLADPRRGDQLVRGMAVLPFGTGREMKIAAFAEGSAAEEAKEAGADLVGAENLLKEVQDTGGAVLSKIDKCIATPEMMKHMGKLGRILGPKGLMPNPKMGTVTTTVGRTIKEMKKGRVEFRADKDGLVHAGIGKVSFPTENLHKNFGALSAAVMRVRPTGLKGSGVAGYVDKVSMSSTMGPGIPITPGSFLSALQTSKE